MVDIKNKEYCPTLEEIGEFIHNSVFLQFCVTGMYTRIKKYL